MQTHLCSVLNTEAPFLCSVLDAKHRKTKKHPQPNNSPHLAQSSKPQKTPKNPPALNIMLRPLKHYADAINLTIA